MSNSLALENIRLNGRADNRDDAIREAADILIKNGYISQKYVDKMFEREQKFSTFIGNGLAIPHGVSSEDYINKTGLSFVRYDNPISWGGAKVHFVIAIASVTGDHMEILSQIALLFSEEENVEKLKSTNSEREILELIRSTNL